MLMNRYQNLAVNIDFRACRGRPGPLLTTPVIKDNLPMRQLFASRIVHAA